jgi:hypothetical protein
MSTFESNEQAISDLDKVDTSPLSRPPTIELEYLNVTGKQGHLVNRDAANGDISIQNGKISIKFPSPMWIYELTLWQSGEEQAKSNKLARHTSATIHFARGGKREIPLISNEGYLDCFPKDFLTEIEIKFFEINKLLSLTPPSCSKITVNGLSAQDFVDFCEGVGRHIASSITLKNVKNKITSELTQVNERITDEKAKLESIHQETAQAQTLLTAELDKLAKTQAALTQAEAKNSIVNTQTSVLEQRITENEKNNKNLAKSIQDNREELQRLLANKNVFMEEFSSYVEQGKNNITSYVVIGLILLGIVGVCLSRLIISAVALSNDPTILTTVSAYDLFISRLPIAVVLGTIMLVCLRMASVLLGKIFEIHQERLVLSKLSILAKDNSFFSAEGLDIPSDLIFDKRVSLKMELLKEFLSGNYKGAAEKERLIKNEFTDFKSRFKKETEHTNVAEDESKED